MDLKELKKCSWQDLLELYLKQKQEINNLLKEIKRQKRIWSFYYSAIHHRREKKLVKEVKLKKEKLKKVKLKGKRNVKSRI